MLNYSLFAVILAGLARMPLYRLLQNQAFEPEHLQAMASAFDVICHERRLHPTKHDGQRDRIAQLVIECAQRGERDPIKLRDQVLELINAEDGADFGMGSRQLIKISRAALRHMRRKFDETEDRLQTSQSLLQESYQLLDRLEKMRL